MRKLVIFGVALIFFALGVILGNQYGRRDVANSRPPIITGQTGAPSSVATGEKGYGLETLPLYDETHAVLYGAVSILKLPGAADVSLRIDKMPPVPDDVANTEFKVMLIKDGQPVRDLTVARLNPAGPVGFRLDTAPIDPGISLAVVSKSGQKILVSDPIRN